MLVEIDPEVGSEHQGQAAAFPENGFLFVGGEVGADKGGGGPVERTVQPEREAVARELRGQRGGRAADEGEVHVREEVSAGAAPTPFPGAGSEKEAQPLEGAGIRSCMSRSC